MTQGAIRLHNTLTHTQPPQTDPSLQNTPLGYPISIAFDNTTE